MEITELGILQQVNLLLTIRLSELFQVIQQELDTHSMVGSLLLLEELRSLRVLSLLELLLSMLNGFKIQVVEVQMEEQQFQLHHQIYVV
jgi:hypothetical protein